MVVKGRYLLTDLSSGDKCIERRGDVSREYYSDLKIRKFWIWGMCWGNEQYFHPQSCGTGENSVVKWIGDNQQVCDKHLDKFMMIEYGSNEHLEFEFVPSNIHELKTYLFYRKANQQARVMLLNHGHKTVAIQLTSTLPEISPSSSNPSPGKMLPHSWHETSPLTPIRRKMAWFHESSRWLGRKKVSPFFWSECPAIIVLVV